MTEETASDKEETKLKNSQQRGGMASNKGDSGRPEGQGCPQGSMDYMPPMSKSLAMSGMERKSEGMRKRDCG